MNLRFIQLFTAGQNMFIEYIFTDLLIIHSLYLLLHDFVDIAPLNNIENIKKYVPRSTKIFLAVTNSIPSILAVILAILYFGEEKPAGVGIYLAAYFAFTLFLIYFDWYKPYLFGVSEKETIKHNLLYSGTHQILPPRNNNPRPNTLHVILHVLFLINTVLMIFVAFNI